MTVPGAFCPNGLRTYVRMTHPPYLREKARKLRVERKISLNEIAECLALNKTTVWYWIEDLPDPEIKRRSKPVSRSARSEAARGNHRAREAAAAANRKRYAAKRNLAYRQGWCEFAILDAEPGFRDFVCMYIGEGSKRERNTVALANSDPRVIRLADFWIRRFALNPVTYSLQYHADQDPDYLRKFWSEYLGVDESLMTYLRKSNSGQLSGRNWRSKYGVLTVRSHDTHLRARLQGWIDRTHDRWLHSVIPAGRSAVW